MTGNGAVDVVIRGPGEETLSDNWFTCAYTPLDPAHVAPFTGARIETGATRCMDLLGLVAPFTGARIETLVRDRTSRINGSPPSRGRGLKQR